MELIIIEKSKNKVKFELKGAGHTFCNNLKNALTTTKGVEVAAYTISHPLVANPTFIVEKDSKADFAKILEEAAKTIKSDNKSFLTAFSKAK